MGRKTGNGNMNKNILYDVINDVVPASKEGWTRVAERYKALSQDTLLRDSVHLKRYFYEIMCSKFKPVLYSTVY